MGLGKSKSVYSFNPRARRGRDIPRISRLITLSCFNPRARRGRDRPRTFTRARNKVSIHAPAGGATHLRAYRLTFIEFQSTRPQGARRIAMRARAIELQFQSTRPQGARPSSCKDRNRLSENGILRQPMSVGSQIDDPERRPFNISRFIN